MILFTSKYSQDETSEAIIGEWAEQRGVRDQLVIATKYTTNYKRGQKSHMVNYSGNSTKSLHVSVEASLKKLRTTYIDILYVHWWDLGWDYTTSVEEVMNSLHVLVQQGKVLYLVRLSHLLHYERCLISRPGNLKHSCMGGFQGEPVCQRPRQDALLRLSGQLVYSRSVI
jgi:hypothetical protein